MDTKDDAQQAAADRMGLSRADYELMKMDGSITETISTNPNGNPGSISVDVGDGPELAVKGKVRPDAMPLNSQQATQIKAGLEIARTDLKKSLKEIKRWGASDKARFKKYFGSDSKSFRNAVKERVKSVLSVVNFYLKDNNFLKYFSYEDKYEGDEGTNTVTNAQTYPNLKTEQLNVYTFAAFYQQNLVALKNEGSQTLIILHEISHFNFNLNGKFFAGTRDIFGYSIYDTKYLRDIDPSATLKNANVFSFYVTHAYE